jgi:hypothetical protein
VGADYGVLVSALVKGVEDFAHLGMLTSGSLLLRVFRFNVPVTLSLVRVFVDDERSCFRVKSQVSFLYAGFLLHKQSDYRMLRYLILCKTI